MTETKKPIDWELIEKDWRAGIKSVLQIATENKISHTAINKHFKKLGIPRDLRAKIKAKADALVSASMVSASVSTETTPSDAEIINANATAISTIQLSHRADIRRNRELSIKMLEELEATTDNRELFEQLGEIMRFPDDRGQDKLNDIYRKILELPSRVDSFKKLTDTLKTLVALEREAYKIDSEDGSKSDGEQAIQDFFAELSKRKPSLLPGE